ncbi:MAG: polysaccharide biosynthesis/export family protein [Bacteroidetes bacterium]|nr:polysaccharide biosynthesis/export family protein [Bacteroidota bacterium]
MRRALSFLVLSILLLSACTVNRDIMFKTPVDYAFDQVKDTLERQFKIQANDVVTFRLFANDGFKMIDLVDDATSLRNVSRMTFNYPVDSDGKAKLPLLGLVQLSGLTVRQAEMMLEEQYTAYYNRPFVLLTVNNRRVVVFPGGGGNAKVVPLENNNTTLMEVIASVGGLSDRGDARKIKLFRKQPGRPREVFQFNMSDIDGLKYADIVMQADDIVYVQPNPEIARQLLQDLTPIVTLLTTTLLVIGYAKVLK